MNKLRLLALFALSSAPALFAASVAPPTAGEVYSAIRTGRIETLQGWLASGWAVNSADERGNTPLIHAAAAGNVATVKMLLGAGADPKMANSLGVTPLMAGAPAAVKAKLLIDAGADVNAVSGMGRTPLVVAAAVPGNSVTVKMLVERGADWKALDKMGINAFVAAAKAGNFEAVRLLAGRGADVSYSPKIGGTALHMAAANRDAAMVRYLLSGNAKVDALLDFSHPVPAGKVAIDRITPLMFAAAYGPIDAVKALLDAGADVNAKDIRGMTPLMFAVSSEVQDPVLVKLLLTRGARMDERSAAGETALDWARKFGRRPVIALLAGGGGIHTAVGEEASHRAATASTAAAMPAETVERAVTMLQQAQGDFFKKTGCMACHHVVAGAFAVKTARARGIATDAGAEAAFAKIAAGTAQGLAPMLIQLVDPPGAVDTVMYALMGMEAAGIEPNAATDALAAYLLRQHEPSRGWWTGGIARAPMGDGSAHRTAMVIKGLNRYLPPAMGAEFETVLAQTRTRLRRDAVVTTDDAAMKLLALSYTGATEAELSAAIKSLESRQRADGGWGGNPSLTSDAYSTGLSIYALAEAKRGARSPSYRRGADWLRRNQAADGSWHVRSRAPKFQPFFESGFPYGGDQWISNMGTAWAVAGLGRW
jgi:ankyrin repeat protein